MSHRPFEIQLTRRHLMFAAAALAIAGEAGSVSAQGQEIVPADVAPKDVYTFLVCGLDTRVVEEPENTDVMMVSRVDVANGTVRSMSFPRDLYLEIPGVGLDKINRAYDYGSKANDHDWNAGVALMEQTFEHNFGIEIDAVISTNFKGLPKVIDALGGVDVENPYDLYDAQYPTEDYGVKEIFYPGGSLHLDGEQALEFGRTRHQDGDDGRVMRQQLILSGLLEKAQEPVNADQLADLVEATRDGVTTNIPQAVQEHLIDAVEAIDPANVVWGTMTEYLWGDTTASGMWVYQADWSMLPGYIQGWLAGE
ncbi:MAG TPA: LCP family protein [Thermomicrobiales bacterium]|nr:LCP family protein [Thermomicrobiales bacterium]